MCILRCNFKIDMMKKIVIIIVFVFISFNVFSQDKYFTDSLFIEQMEDFISPIFKIHPEVKTEFEKLEENWNSGFIDNLKPQIVDVSNKMKNQKLNPYPYFLEYIVIVNALVYKQDLDFYSKWETNFLNLLNLKQSKNITVFLQSSKLLIKDSLIYQNKAISWKALSSDYRIYYDSKTNLLLVEFKSDFDLLCFNTSDVNRDTMKINQTSGKFSISEKKFFGNYAQVFWNKENKINKNIYAKFQKYEIALKFSKFSVDTVAFYHNDLNLTNIKGSLNVKLVNSKIKTASPIFESFEPLIIQNIFPDVDYHGYIQMKGEKLLGIAKDNDVTVYVRDQNKNVATIRSSKFELEKNSTIKALSAEFSFYFNDNQDSIYHADVDIKYLSKISTSIFKHSWFKFDSDSGNYLIVSRKDQGALSVPLTNTYHNLDIYNDKMLWAKGDSIIYFVTTFSSNKEYTEFRSVDFFDKDVYDYFSGKKTDKVNHLAEIKLLYKKLKKTGQVITIERYQKRLKNSRNQELASGVVEKLFQKLAYFGFVEYNRDDKTIIPAEKLYTYQSNALRIRKQDSSYSDFDRLVIVSRLGKPGVLATNIGVNAIIDMSTNNLSINNVQDVWLSPSVRAKTSDIVVKQNRNLSFGGELGVGLLNFTGPTFEYDYELNEVAISDNSKLNFGYIDTLSTGKYHYFPISTTMSNVVGTVLVNQPDNKSNTLGKIEYPKFIIQDTAKVYYEKFVKKYSTKAPEDIINDDFCFNVYVFQLDSLRYLQKKALEFDGLLHTGLFKDLQVTYNVREGVDTNYLGFEECTGSNDSLKDGLDFKDGKFFGCFLLNDDGLGGKGYIEYFSAKVFSQNIIFIPSRVTAQTDSVFIDNAKSIRPSIKEDIPFVIGKNLDFVWTDSMYFAFDPKIGDNIISLYSDISNKETILNGSIKYIANEIKGKGTLVFEDAEIIDTAFNFKANSFDVRRCDFNLKLQQTSQFVTKNLNGHVDIKKQMGSFYSNNDTTKIYFKENNYVCIMDHFLWKIGEGIVNIGGIMPGKDTNDYVNSIEDKIEKKKDNNKIKLFGTILENTIDTLHFSAAATTYDIKNKIIIADNVQSLKIADAMIFPRGKVRILKGGIIDTLKSIAFSFPYKPFAFEQKEDYLYSFSDAYVLIKNRYNYKAILPRYYYPYMHQKIIFDKAYSVNSPYSVAELVKMKPNDIAGIYSEATKITGAGDSLMLNRHFDYYGNGGIVISSKNAFPRIRGYVKMDSTCDNKKVPTILFKLDENSINPDTVKIPFSADLFSKNGNVKCLQNFKSVYRTIKRCKNLENI